MLLFLLAGCQTPPRTATSATDTDTTWAGEVSVRDGKTLFRPCGREFALPLRGPALDSLLVLYRAQAIQPGQRMMAWVTGHLTSTDSVTSDSFFLATSVGHLDALRMCPLMPLPRLSARYSATLVEHLGNRLLTLDLYPNGVALQLTSMRDQALPFEQEGRWGADANGMIEVDMGPSFPKGYYTVSGDSLVRIQTMTHGAAPRFVMTRTGPADPAAGVRGLVVAWADAVSARHCSPLDRATSTSSTTLSALFPAKEALRALEDSAITWLPLDTAEHHLGEPGLATIGDLVAWKRRALLLRP